MAGSMYSMESSFYARRYARVPSQNDRMCSSSETPFFRKNAWTAMANGIYFKKTVGQSRTFMSRENTNTKKPVVRRVCRALMETTSGEEVFAFIAATASTGKKMTIRWKSMFKKPENQPQRNREVILNHTKQKVSKEELEILTRH